MKNVPLRLILHVATKTKISYFSLIFMLCSMVLQTNKLQAQGYCGVLPPHTASTNNPDSILMDRFGNTYDVYPLIQGSNSPAPFTAGYFEITYFGPDSLKSIIDSIFTEFSNLIPRKTNHNLCNELIGQEKVKVSIEADYGDSTAGLASASPLWGAALSVAPCDASNVNEFNLTINSGRGKKEDSDGILFINLNYPWYIDYNVPPTMADSNKYDLRSVLTHEILHLYGFSSLIGSNGKPINSSFGFDVYDNYLYRYDNMGNQGIKVLIGNCQQNCWRLNQQIQFFDSSVANNCSANSNYIFGIGNPYLAPVNGMNGYNSNSMVGFGNYLSHLHPNCLNSNPNYIMQPKIDTGVRRVIITNQELEILCKLGYTTPNCQGCHIGAFNEFLLSEVDAPKDCCTKIYTACLGQTLKIPKSEILCNDAAGSAISLSDLYFFPTSGLTLNNLPDTLEFTASYAGTFPINYTLTACDCKQHNARFQITFTNCQLCDNKNPCTNLICSNGFEEFNPRFISFTLPYIFAGTFWNFNNSKENTPDICTEASGNHYMHIGSSNTVKEGISFKLLNGIKPNENMHLRFKANGGGSIVNMVIIGSSAPPCNILNTSTSFGCSGSNCAYDPICIKELVIPNAGNTSFGCQSNANLSDFTFDTVNQSTKTINYITIYPKPKSGVLQSLFLDDVVITKDSLPITSDFTDSIDFCTVKFKVNPIVSGMNYSWDFGDQTVGTGPIINHTYASDGTYTVRLIITDNCGAADTISKDVTVICNPIPVCNCPGGYTVGVDQNSVTDITATSIPASTVGINTPICINGKLKINRNNQLFRDKIVYMGEGASIEVNPGYRFTTIESNYVPCQGIMYKGIVVSGGYILANGNTINDAHIGIDLQEGATLGGMIGNTFDRNYIGINAFGTIGGYTTFESNHFISNGTYLTAYAGEPAKLGTNNKTWAGINLNFTPLITVNNGNEFIGIGAGVRAKNAVLVMNKNHAQDLIFSNAFQDGSALIASNCPSLTVNDNTIENCFVAINVSKSNLLAERDSITECQYGFYCDKMDNKNLQISRSKRISFHSYGIYINGSSNIANLNIFANKLHGLSNALTGIRVFGNAGANQGNANIYDHNTEFSIPKTCNGIEIVNYQKINIYSNNIVYQTGGRGGIVLLNAPLCFLGNNTINGDKNVSPKCIGIGATTSPFVTYCCNSVPNNATGLDFFDNCDQSHLRHNRMTNNTFGLQCAKATWIGLQKLGYSNYWPGSATNFEAVHNGSDDDMKNSRFDVTAGPSDFYPDPPPPAIWFNILPGNNKACLQDLSCIVPVEVDTMHDDDGDRLKRYYNDEAIEISPTDAFTADPTSVWGSYEEGQKWNAGIQLLEKLDLFPQLLGQVSLVDNFYTANQSSLLHNYHLLRVALKKSANITPAEYTAVKNYNTSILTVLNQIKDLDSLLSLSGADTVVLLDQRTNLLTELTNTNFSYEALHNSLELQWHSVLNGLYTQVSALPASTTTQVEEKSVNLHLIQYLLQGSVYLSPSVLSQLFAIANQCLHKNNYAISVARMLYNKAVAYNFDDELICPQAGLSKTDGLNNQDDVLLYPNPTNANFTFESRDTKTKLYLIGVSDIHGRELSLPVQKISGVKLRISTESLMPGVYFVRYKTGTKDIKIKKLIVE